MSSNESNLFFDLLISKIESNGEEISYFIIDTEETEGMVFVQDQSPFFNIISPYHETNTSFSSKIGIKLSEKGTFALKTGVIKNKSYIIAFDTQSTLGSIQMTTNIANSDAEGIYRFTVE